MDKELITFIIEMVLAVLSVVLTTYVIPWIKQSANAKKFNEIMAFCEKCVEAAEKKVTPEEWEEKKLYVMKLVAAQIKKLGANISAEELDALIDGFVHEVKG